MASIRKYRDKWRAEVQRHGIRASHVADTKREAQTWALAKEAELDRLKGSGGKTLGDAVGDYVKTVSQTKSKPEWEEKRFQAFMDYIGEKVPLSSITSADIGRWRDFRLQTVTGATVQREANLLRNLFTVAMDEWRWIDSHPFRGVRMPEQIEARRQVWGWLFLEPPFMTLHLKMLALFAAIFAPTVFLIWRTDRNREKRDSAEGAPHG